MLINHSGLDTRTSATADLTIAEVLDALPAPAPEDDSCQYLAASSLPLVAVADNKFAPGLRAGGAWVWPRSNENADGVADVYDVLPLDDALARSWRSDAHFVPFVLAGADGRVLARQPRLRIESLATVRRAGFDVRLTSLWADVDNPEHAPWTEALWERARAKLAHPLLGSSTWYSTRAGVRIGQPLSRWVSPEEFPAVHADWLQRLERDAGLKGDPQCRDWTRHYRLPLVVRDGQLQRPVGRWAWRAVAPLIVPAPRHASGTDTRQAVALLRAAGVQHDRVERARRYVAAIAPPEHGTGRCEVETFKVAILLVRGFVLDEGVALGLLREWTARSAHPWTDRELLHKVSDAARSKADRGFLLKGVLR